jgi:N-acetyl-anhydromuramyl-L-alanine amidase AmpD
MRPIRQIILHCSALTYGNADQIRAWHTKRGFDDIGYHYIVLNGRTKSADEYDRDLDGKIEPGRQINHMGAHCEDDNYDSVGVCMVGDREFTPAQIETVYDIIQDLRGQYGQIPVFGHYEKASGIRQGKTCPNIDMDEFRRHWEL